MSLKRTKTIALFAVTGLAGLAISAVPLSGQDKAPEKSAGAYDGRFDHQVREDLFAGFGGDEEALKRGMEHCKATLKTSPKHAEAMVWLGAARIYLAGEAFNKGDAVNGMQYWTKGLAEMDKAVELEPNNIGVLIPRAAVLLPAGRGAPEAIGKPVLERVLSDFERAYARQKNQLDQLGEHPLGELRMGMADVYRLLGQPEKSREHLTAVQTELPGTEYAERATAWLAAKPDKPLAHNCIGCHSN